MNFITGSDLYVLGVVETWIKPHLPTGLFDIHGFNFARLDRFGMKRGGGVGCYIRSDLTWELTDLLYNNYLAALNITAPFATLTNVKTRKTWITPELLGK